MPLPLGYAEVRPPPPSRLTLDVGRNTVRLTFPVAPRWLLVLSICMSGVAGCAKAIGAILFYRMLDLLARSFPSHQPGLWHVEMIVCLPLLASAAAWWAIAGYQWYALARHGRVPRVLTATPDGLSYSRPTWRGVRERHWPRAEIRSFEVCKLRRNMTPWRPAAELRIRFTRGRRQFRFATPDPCLIDRLRDGLSAIWGDTPSASGIVTS